MNIYIYIYIYIYTSKVKIVFDLHFIVQFLKIPLQQKN